MNDPVQQVVVTAVIEPIKYKDLMNVGKAEAKAEGKTIYVPIEVEGVAKVEMHNGAPTPETMQFALMVAERLTTPEELAKLPHTQAVAEMLALAFTVKHYVGGTK